MFYYFFNYSPLSQFEVNIFPFINFLNFTYYGNFIESLTKVPSSHFDYMEYEFDFLKNPDVVYGYYNRFFYEEWIKVYKLYVFRFDEALYNLLKKDFIDMRKSYNVTKLIVQKSLFVGDEDVVYMDPKEEEYYVWQLATEIFYNDTFAHYEALKEIQNDNKSLIDLFTFQFWIDKYNFYVKFIVCKLIIIFFYYTIIRLAQMGSIRNRFRTHMTVIKHFENVKRPTYYHLVHNWLDSDKTDKAIHQFTLWGKGMYKTPKTNIFYLIVLSLLIILFLPFYSVTDSFFTFYDKNLEDIEADLDIIVSLRFANDLMNENKHHYIHWSNYILFKEVFYHIFEKEKADTVSILFFKEDQTYSSDFYKKCQFIALDEYSYGFIKKIYTFFYKYLDQFFGWFLPIKEYDHIIWRPHHLWDISSGIFILYSLGENFDIYNNSLHIIHEYINIYSLDILFSFISIYLLLFIFNKDSFSYNSNTLVPNKYQLISEYIYKLALNLFISNIGKNVKEKAFFIKIITILLFVLISNVQGMIPYMSTLTSSLSNTFFIALALFTSIIITILKKKGWKYLLCLFMPEGCPIVLLLLLIPIEVISYSFRVVSLSVRLFANMMAGHTLLKVIVGFSWEMILLGQLFLLINFIPVITLFILTLLEIGVAFIQTYIFTILTCIYLKDIFFGH